MQKIIWNSKVYIIHKLGGYTEEEHKSIYKAGINRANSRIYYFVNSLYGKDKQDWIDIVYDYIKQQYEQRF